MRDRFARSMRAVRFVALVIVVAVGAVGCADVALQQRPALSRAVSTGPPKVTVAPERQRLGVLALGEDAVGEVLVGNEGSVPLTLSVADVRLGTRVEGLVHELQPGQSARLRFVVDTFLAEARPLQTWTLVTNDPDRPRVAITLELDVRPFVVARPGYARYITVQHAREGTIIQTLGALDGADFRVLRVESPVPALRVAFREATADERQPAWSGRQWRVAITLASDAPVGPIIGALIVNIDHPRQRRVMIPLSGFVRPVLAVTPPEAQVGDLPRTRKEPISYFVKNFAEETIEMTGVSTTVGAVRAEIQPIERGRTWNLKLFVVPGAPAGPFEGKVVLSTASPKVPRLEIPLSGRLVD